MDGNAEKWLENLREAYDRPEDEQASRQREHVSRLKLNLGKMLKRLNLDRANVLSYIIETVGIFYRQLEQKHLYIAPVTNNSPRAWLPLDPPRHRWSSCLQLSKRSSLQR